MKKTSIIMFLAICALFVHGQGYLIVQSTVAGISTNTSDFYAQDQGIYSAGKTTTAPNAFYYALLFDATMPTGNSSPTNSGWSLATQANNSALALNNSTTIAGGITGTGTSGGVQVNMAAGTTYYVELVGWSAILGTTFSQVEPQLASDNFEPGLIGYTSVGTMTPFAAAGAGDPTIFPTAFLDGSLSLYTIETPEPSTLALAAIGGVSLLLFYKKII